MKHKAKFKGLIALLTTVQITPYADQPGEHTITTETIFSDFDAPATVPDEITYPAALNKFAINSR